jgi:hypothetical protein
VFRREKNEFYHVVKWVKHDVYRKLHDVYRMKNAPIMTFTGCKHDVYRMKKGET